MIEYKRLILIDMDPVYKKELENGVVGKLPPAKPDTKKFLKKLSKIGYVKFCSSLNYKGVIEWLELNNLDTYNVVDTIYCGSYLVLDGKCICYEGDFSETYEKITRFKDFYDL